MRKQFKVELLKESEEKDDFTKASKEWQVIGHDTDNWGYCICGQRIKNRVMIDNIHNLVDLVIGANCCQSFLNFLQPDVNRLIKQKNKEIKYNNQLKKMERLMTLHNIPFTKQSI